LNNAYIMNSKEALNSLSMLRLGVDMKLIKSIDIQTVNELFILAQPAHLQKYAGKVLDQEERDVARASLIRERLKHKK
jgi:protein arginine kinase